MAKVCSFAQVTVLQNGTSVDDLSATALGTALVSGCAPAPLLRTRSMAPDGGVLDPLGAPLTGPDELLVTAGGSFFNAHVRWLETVGEAPIIDSFSGGVFTWVRRSDGGVLVQATADAFDGGRDYFAIELIRSPPRGALSLVAQGTFATGTRAASWYFVNRLLPQLSTFGNAWYVVEWTDTNADGFPDPGDSFVTLATSN